MLSPKKQLGATPRGFWSWQSVFAAALGTIAMLGSAVKAGSLDLGVAGNYAVVALGSGKKVSQNSGPINGSELFGNSVQAAFSGGANQPITGTVYYDPTVTGTNTFSQFQPAITTSALPDTTLTNSALASAEAVSIYAESLPATQVFSNTITGNGGLNVIDVTNIANGNFTITGSASDIFVFNVSGKFSTNDTMVLGGAVKASQILFNFLGTSGDVFQTSGGNTTYGTFLATRGGDFQFSNLNLNGALINTAGGMQIVSGSGINTFTPFSPVPLPAAFWAGSVLLASVGGFRVIRKRWGLVI